MTGSWRQAARYETYSAKYFTMSFLELVDTLYTIEDDLLAQMAAELLQYFESLPTVEVRGDVVLLDGQPHQLSLRRDQGSRELSVHLVPLDGQGVQFIDSRDDLQLFGQVSRLTVTVPRGLAYLREEIRRRCLGHVKSAYTALRLAYQSSYTRWAMSHFEAIYSIINTQLLLNNSGHLRNRFWLSVTDARDAKFKYYLGGETLGAAADWLMKRQDDYLSPCLALTILITKEVADGFYLPATAMSALSLDEDTFVLKFNQLPTLGSETAFWHAEHRLFSSGELAAIRVKEVDNRSFEINCAANDLPTIRPAVVAVRKDLGTIIVDRYRDFQRDRRRLENSLSRATGAVALIQDVGTDIVAKFLAEIVKP